MQTVIFFSFSFISEHFYNDPWLGRVDNHSMCNYFLCHDLKWIVTITNTITIAITITIALAITITITIAITVAITIAIAFATNCMSRIER